MKPVWCCHAISPRRFSLFVAGTLAASGSLKLNLVLGLLITAAILGNMLNYSVGRLLTKKVLGKEHLHFVKPEHIERTHQFFEKYGGKAIIITRFVRIVRSFAPFLAGAGAMSYRKFFLAIRVESSVPQKNANAGYKFCNGLWMKAASLPPCSIGLECSIKRATEEIRQDIHLS